MRTREVRASGGKKCEGFADLAVGFQAEVLADLLKFFAAQLLKVHSRDLSFSFFG